MSDPDAARTSSPCPGPSEPLEVDLHVFACGHGDTLLLRLPGNRWALVDCFLPSRAVRARFFEFVAVHGIERLDYVFQTHPDYDHFFGMTHVLDYFTRDGRSLGYWCDGGLNGQRVQSLLWPDSISQKHYARLQRRLDDLDEHDLIRFVELNDRVEPTSAEGHDGRADLFPIGPSARTKRRILRGDLQRLEGDPRARLEANALSVVLVLAVSENDEHWNILLAADAGADELVGALESWEQRAQTIAGSERFDAIKVPHHGSLASHTERLCRAKRADREIRFAVVSAGTRAKLPDRHVLCDYLTEGWTVMLTTRRHAPRRHDRPFTLAQRRELNWLGTTHDLTLAWRSGKGLSATPPDAVVGLEDLDIYETAGGA